MSRQRSRDYKARIDAALGASRQQDALHRFGDAYLQARQEAFADLDFEALREVVAELKDEVGRHRQRYLAQFIEQAEAAGAQVFRAADAAVQSNAPVPGVAALTSASEAPHALLDLGSDEYTRGRPHPMIDPEVRDKLESVGYL